jgi:predicted nucleotidyltransferase component of viral defense system
MASFPLPDSKLSALQRDVLLAFFEREQRFFLTGGSALGGFYLLHRYSDDLDLFTTDQEASGDAERALDAAATACGATVRSLRRFPEFRRYLVTRGEEETVIDLVLERVPQTAGEKRRFGTVRVDPLEEIAANKLCALLGRCEAKDLVDLEAILGAGIRLEDALHAAERKDAGVSAASLAYVLDQWRIGEQAQLPGGADPRQVEQFRRALVSRLAELALPGDHD